MIISELHTLFLKSNGVCTDTRKIKKNELFFALKGDNFNGNEYAEHALLSGASFAIIDEEKYKYSENIILVDDVLKTLQDLARYHRNFLKTPVLALTGSNGKTTTKELIDCVLSLSYKTTATSGNLNNHIGVPLTLLSMTSDTEIGIIEIGANHQGEINFLCKIAEPDYGYITNIGKAHLEGFGGIEGVLKGKTEIYRHLKKNKKLVFLNLDDEKLSEEAQELQVFSFSQHSKSDVIIKIGNNNPFLSVLYEGTIIQSNLTGSYNFTNIAAAITIAKYFELPINLIKKAIESYYPDNNRSQLLKKETYTIVMDAYNANPTSMEAAISNFDQMDFESKNMFLGDMFELGIHAAEEHERIIELALNTKVDHICVIGENFFKTTLKDSRVTKYKTFDDFKFSWNAKKLKKGVLIKGSRGMQLERILEFIDV